MSTPRSSARYSESDGAALFRLVMLGQSGAGKSNVADRFVRNVYTDPHRITLGVEFQTKILVLSNGNRVKFEIWDTSGQERYAVLAPMYYRGAHGAIVVYDITDKKSFDRAKEWVDELKQHALAEMVVVLAGNKIDVGYHRQVDSLDAEVFADDNGLLFAEISAKTGVGIQEMFEKLAQRLLNDMAMTAPPNHNRTSRLSTVNSPTDPKRKSVPEATPSSPNDVIKLQRAGDATTREQRGCSCGSVVITVND